LCCIQKSDIKSETTARIVSLKWTFPPKHCHLQPLHAPPRASNTVARETHMRILKLLEGQRRPWQIVRTGKKSHRKIDLCMCMWVSHATMLDARGGACSGLKNRVCWVTHRIGSQKIKSL
jgi:hypothetical protein